MMGRLANPEPRDRFNVVIPPWLKHALEERIPEFGDRNRVIQIILEAFWDAPLQEILERRQKSKWRKFKTP